VRSIPAPPEITLPAGAPGPLCLYAVHRPGQLDTLVYLCNAGPGALANVTVATDTISVNQYFTAQSGEERWAEEGRTREQRWEVIPPGTCIRVASLNHCMWDWVSRHCLAYTDAAGRRWAAEAHDLNLTLYDPSQGPDQVWLAFEPARRTDQPTAERQFGETI